MLTTNPDNWSAFLILMRKLFVIDQKSREPTCFRVDRFSSPCSISMRKFGSFQNPLEIISLAEVRFGV